MTNEKTPLNPKDESNTGPLSKSAPAGRAATPSKDPEPVAPKPQRAPMPKGGRQSEAKKATAALTARFAAKRDEDAEKQRKATEEPEGVVYFLRCRENLEHPAVFFTGKPELSHFHISDREWYASYKAPDATWSGKPICQVCLAMDQRRIPQEWRSRHVGQMSREEYDALMEVAS
jgi:hypothetical protein